MREPEVQIGKSGQYLEPCELQQSQHHHLAEPWWFGIHEPARRPAAARGSAVHCSQHRRASCDHGEDRTANSICAEVRFLASSGSGACSAAPGSQQSG
jgi:hypothetical protein